MINGFTIKSESSEGIYYLIKDRMKHRAFWVKESKIRNKDYLFTTEGRAIRSLEKLLNTMDDYAKDKFTLVSVSESITECAEVTVKNMSRTYWKNDFKATAIYPQGA